MSGPSPKPFGSNDNSAYDSQRGDGDNSRSPYAPKRVRGGFIAEPPHRDATRSDDDDAPPPRFLLGSRNAGEERGLTDFAENSLQYGEESPKSGRAEEDAWQSMGRHPASGGSGYFAETYGRDYATDRNNELPEEDELRRL